MKATNEMIAAAQSAHRRMLDKSAWMPADEMRAAIEAALAATPQGEWVMVPREATEAMCKAGWTPEDPTPVGIWALMIAAAPPCPVTTCRVDGPGTVTVTATGVMFESSEKYRG